MSSFFSTEIWIAPCFVVCDMWSLRALAHIPVLCVVLAIVGGCKHSGDADGDDDSGGGGSGDAGPAPPCEGLACDVVDCSAQGLPSTSLSGTVYAPNGTLPLYGVNVYVPASPPGPLPAGAQCDRCGDALLGGAITQTVTDEAGHFRLAGVPVADDVPLVIQVGKWRRQLVLPSVAACQDSALPTVSTTLPRTHSEGDMPQIAVTTGSADALDCLVRKLGIDDSEITTDAQAGKVHLYNGNGANQFATGFGGGSGTFSSATTLWGDADKLAGYDIVLFSCEGKQNATTKPQSALQVVHDYADHGGRVFLSHWHNIWVGGEDGHPEHGLPDWEQVATFDYNAVQDEKTQLTFVDETVPKGTSFATWLQNVGASTTRDEIQVNDPRYTCQSVTPGKAERWVYVDPAQSTPLGKTGVQNMLFTTPQDHTEDNRCGKVVLSDMHVASGSTSKAATPYPGGCSSEPLSPQEKALAFIFFDIASCVGILQ